MRGRLCAMVPCSDTPMSICADQGWKALQACCGLRQCMLTLLHLTHRAVERVPSLTRVVLCASQLIHPLLEQGHCTVVFGIREAYAASGRPFRSGL